MSLNNGTFSYGKEIIRFEVLYVDRKTLEISVHPDSRVVIKAPLGTCYEDIKKKVTKRARWIKQQLEYFSQFDPRTPIRRYIGGETHLYLGKQYRLKIINGDAGNVKLSRGYFYVQVKGDITPDVVRKLLEDWYSAKAAVKFKESFDRCWLYFEKHSLNKPRLQIRRMKKRWGSLSPNGLLTLNLDLIRAPKECIDYVVMHELCHLQHFDHSAEFYKLLERVMPDWGKRKNKLELALI